jgi:hypothetical protein
MNPTPSRRTWFTTLLAAAAILLGGLGSLFSLFALLLAVQSPHGNTADPLGIFLIFILPPGTLLAGFGLLFFKGTDKYPNFPLATSVKAGTLSP